MAFKMQQGRSSGIGFFGIRISGISFIGIFGLLGLLEAESFSFRTPSKINSTSIIKTVTGVSEQQCLHKCRRAPGCKNSAYEKDDGHKKSKCHFLKEGATAEGPNEEESNTANFLHLEVPFPGKYVSVDIYLLLLFLFYSKVAYHTH